MSLMTEASDYTNGLKNASFSDNFRLRHAHRQRRS